MFYVKRVHPIHFEDGFVHLTAHVVHESRYSKNIYLECVTRRTIFYFLFKKKKTYLIIRNYFLFYVLKNIKYDILKKISFNYFVLFFLIF